MTTGGKPDITDFNIICYPPLFLLLILNIGLTMQIN